MPWHPAARVQDVDVGGLTRFRAGSHEYALARVSESEWVACDLSCTHQYAELDATGVLIGPLLTCVSHGATFDLSREGAVVSPALSGGATPRLRTFPARVEGDRVLVDVPEGDKPPEPPWG